MEVFTFNCTRHPLTDSSLAGEAQNMLHVWLLPCASPTAAGGLFNAKVPFLLAQQCKLHEYRCTFACSLLRAEHSCRTELQSQNQSILSWKGITRIIESSSWNYRVLFLRGSQTCLISAPAPSVILLLSSNWGYFSFQSMYDPTDKLN